VDKRVAKPGRDAVPWIRGTHSRLAFGGVTLLVVVSVASIGAAGAGDYVCGHPDGTATFAYPRGYCRLTHFPGLPDSVSSVFMTLAIFGAPIVAAIAAVVFSRRGDRPLALKVATIIAVLLTVNAWALTALLSGFTYKNGP
jgi:fucose permease